MSFPSINHHGVITNMKDFNIDENLTFSSITKTKMGSDIVYINSKYPDGTSGKFNIQLNKMPAIFGLSRWQNNENEKLSIDLSFKNIDDNVKHTYFLNFLNNLDDAVINKGRINYLGAEKSQEVAKELYKKCVKTSEGYSPTFKIAVTQSTKLYNSKKQEVSICEDNIPKGALLDVIISISSIWIINKKSFGISIRAEQIRVRQESSGQLPNYAFVDSNSDHSDIEDCQL